VPDWKHAQNSIEPSAHDWASIVAFYADLAQYNHVFGPMAELATLIARSPYVAAGLSALTSMHVLGKRHGNCLCDEARDGKLRV
jgi:hypothetical protein